MRGVADDLLLADLHAIRVCGNGVWERRQQMLAGNGQQSRWKEIDVKARALRQRLGRTHGGAEAMMIDERQNVALRADAEEIVRHLEHAVGIAAQEFVRHLGLIREPVNRLFDGPEIFSLRETRAEICLRVLPALRVVDLLFFVDHSVFSFILASAKDLMCAREQLID